MAFYKTGNARIETTPLADISNFTKQAEETCQTCGYRMSRDETGELVCRTPKCAKAVDSEVNFSV